MRPPIRRVLALDPGSRCIKFLLAEKDFGRLRILKTESIDLQREGLVAPDEIKAHVQSSLESLDGPPIALVLPQHLSTSQVIDLPLVPEAEVRKLIEEETVKLSGVSESRIVYDFVRAGPAAKNRQRFWVTLCQERDILERIERLGLEHRDLCEVSTTANALIAAYRAAAPLSSRAILVHAGAQSTVVVILLEGQGVFAASFQMGGDFFTRALARLRNCTEETADALKRDGNLLSGPEAQPGFPAVVDGWLAELKRQLNDWFGQHPGIVEDASPMELVASGGAFEQPGLLDYLKEAGVRFRPWPTHGRPEPASAPKGYEVAFGTALQALGQTAQPVSLLPEEFRAAWQKRLARQRLELGSTALVLICAVLFAFGTWHQWSLLHRKQALLGKVRAGIEQVNANARLTDQLAVEYEALRPLFARQQNSLDTLKTLALLQQSRSNRSFWYVVLADQQSYFSHPPAPAGTNRPTARASVGAFSPHLFATPDFFSLPLLTNLFPANPGFIAELCVPETAERARTLLSQLVSHLNAQPLFSKVDLLSDDLRRNLAEPAVVLPDRHFVLKLDFAETDFQRSVRPRDPSSAGNPPRVTPKRPPRPAWMTPDNSAQTRSPVTPVSGTGVADAPLLTQDVER